MVGAPDVVQPWMPRAARDSDAWALPREHRGWRDAPRMCRSRRIGILQRALQPERAPHGSDVTARHGHSLAPPALHDQLELAPWASLDCADARKVDEESPVDTQELASGELHFELVD